MEARRAALAFAMATVGTVILASAGFAGARGDPGRSGGQLPVRIDIKPGSASNVVNPSADGVLPVAILGEPGQFQVQLIDARSLRFGPGGAQALRWTFGEVNGDGILDLLTHFRIQDAVLSCDPNPGVLTGTTVAGTPFRGSDLVTLVPAGTPGGGDPIVLTDGHDDWIGTGKDETVLGGKGHDELASQGGDDWVDGGEDNDVILTGPGDDVAIGGTGVDTILTGPGDDIIVINAGDVPAGKTEQIFAGRDDDTVIVNFDYVIVGSGPNLVIIEDPITHGIYVIQDAERIIRGGCAGPPIE